MNRVMASAPGKLFFFGEYAVLARGWCIVAAVDRRVRAWAREGGGGYEVMGASFTAGDALPRAALRAVGEDEAIVSRFTTDVRQLYDGEHKLGLGSSAASTVALLRAVSDADAAGVFRAAFGAHRELQRGRGSGADVAASCWGGLLAYRLSEPQAPFPSLDEPPLEGARDEQLASVLALTWPEHITARAVWTGQPASSTELVGAVEAKLATDHDEVVATLDQLAQTTTRAIEAIQRESLDAMMAVTRQADALMEQLGELCDAPIATPRHAALRAYASRFGVACKPSGAGGGDFSLLIGPREADWPILLNGLPEGCRHVPMRFFDEGARREG